MKVVQLKSGTVQAMQYATKHKAVAATKEVLKPYTRTPVKAMYKGLSDAVYASNYERMVPSTKMTESFRQYGRGLRVINWSIADERCEPKSK